MTNQPPVVDRVCTCMHCETSDRPGRYVMTGYCSNCGAEGLLGVFRVGDRAEGGRCTVCEVRALSWVKLADDQSVRP